MILSILPAAKTVKNILIFGGLLIIAVAIPVTTLALRQKQVYLSQAATQTCAEVASEYGRDYYLCSDDLATGSGCGEEGSRATTCYYGIQVTTGTDCDPNHCRYYNLARSCGSNKSECEERCSSDGCAEEVLVPVPATCAEIASGYDYNLCSDLGPATNEHGCGEAGTSGENVCYYAINTATSADCGGQFCRYYNLDRNCGSNRTECVASCMASGCVGVTPTPTKPTPPPPGQTCAEIASGYDYHLCSSLSATGSGCGPADDPTRSTVCYYHINTASSTDCGDNYCRYYDRDFNCGSNKSECEEKCTANGCEEAEAEGPRCEGIRLYAERKTGGLEQGTYSEYLNLTVTASNPNKGDLEFKVETIKPSGVKVTHTSGETLAGLPPSCQGETYCQWSTFDCQYFGCAWAHIPFPETCQCPQGTYQVTVSVNDGSGWVTSAACSGSVYIGSTEGDEYDTLSEPPVVSDMSAQVSGNTATVSWKTDIQATGEVRYSPKEAYRVPDGWIKHYGCRQWSYSKRAEQPNLTTEHQVTIPNMSADVCSYCFFDDGWCFKITACNWLGECTYTDAIEYSTSGGGGIVPATVSPPTPEQAQEADLNDNDTLDIGDYGALVSDYGKEEEALPTDFDGDGKVTILDYSQFVDIYQEWAGLEIPSE